MRVHTPPPPPLLASKSLPFYTSELRPINGPENQNFSSSRFGMGDLATPRRRELRCGVPKATIVFPSATSRRRLPSLLRSAMSQRGSPHCCVAETICYTSLPYSQLLSFLLLLASFFILISPRSMKHYSIGD